MISFRSVSLRYPASSESALDGVTLDVGDHEMLAVVGANGSGKSTLGRLANALLLPTSGTVVVDGVDTSSPEGTAAARSRVGMVFQNPDSGIVGSSVEEDIAFALENRAVPRSIMAERVAHTLELLGLAEHRLAHPLELSTSDRARLGLAAAFVVNPRYLIMDEATAYLDSADRASLLGAVTDLRAATGMAIVLITHVMDEALAADRVAVLMAGRIVFTGTARALFADADRARRWRLELPPLLQLQEDLRDRGIDLGHEPLSVDSAQDRLCRL